MSGMAILGNTTECWAVYLARTTMGNATECRVVMLARKTLSCHVGQCGDCSRMCVSHVSYGERYPRGFSQHNPLCVLFMQEETIGLRTIVDEARHGAHVEFKEYGNISSDFWVENPTVSLGWTRACVAYCALPQSLADTL